MDIYHFSSGDSPLLISVPHAGTHLPVDIADRMTENAKTTPDTDWHVDRLYDFADEVGASLLVATHSRFVVDLNRPADDKNLYPGQNTTGLCPVDCFDERPIYLNETDQPNPAEIARRVPLYWQPYHDKLRETLDRLREKHGYALLWDAHSIRSQVPRFFSGRLPDLNIGTANGKSCAASLADKLLSRACETNDYTSILNGRFKGGHITRHYGQPDENIHAVQLELSQITYMNEEPPFAYREDLAAGIKPVLRNLIEEMIRFKP
ncbi:N-formylglutamate deformylase [Aestuariispira insulae]|nr:N-formylglutamate deformylase [Aestuariispira insulae]